MTVYAYVEDNAIKEIHHIKPMSWKNVSNFHLVSDDELKNFNWYPVVDEIIEYDPNLKEVVDFEYRFDSNQVKRVYLLIDKPASVTPTEEPSVI